MTDPGQHKKEKVTQYPRSQCKEKYPNLNPKSCSGASTGTTVRLPKDSLNHALTKHVSEFVLTFFNSIQVFASKTS